MRRGKRICETLKTVRKQIADANGIEYNPSQCSHTGECAGTCPKCESEVQYLERELAARRHLGKAAVVAGLALGLTAVSSAPLEAKTPKKDKDCKKKVVANESRPDVLEGYVPLVQEKVAVILTDNVDNAKEVVVTVRDYRGQLLNGAVVKCVESEKNAATNRSGQLRVMVGEGETLIVSHMSCEPQTIKVGEENEINVRLDEPMLLQGDVVAPMPKKKSK